MKEKEYLSIKQKEQRKSYLESKMTKYEIIDKTNVKNINSILSNSEGVKFFIL